MALEQLQNLVAAITGDIQGRSVNEDLQSYLNEHYPSGGDAFTRLRQACMDGIDNGELCQHEAGGIRYGRAMKPGPETHDYSVDVVVMDDCPGPHHAHPTGEIDMIMPVDSDARFDGHGEGWLVYTPGSAHVPTVAGGKAVILYLLPEGRIEFS